MDKREALYKDVSSLEVVAYITRDGDFEDGVTYILEKLDVIPVADVQPVRHGKWIFNKEKRTWECSECHYQTDSIFDESKTNYCPNCGAKMGVQ